MGFHVEIAEGSPFTLANLPFGVISEKGSDECHCATAIGQFALDLHLLSQQGFFKDNAVADALLEPDLAVFAALPGEKRRAARQQMIDALKSDRIEKHCFRPLDTVDTHLPMEIKGYADFFCSLEHCTNCSPMTNGQVPQNIFKAPSAYNGRASSVRPSPHMVRRPKGIFWDQQDEGKRETVSYKPSMKIDYELEMGYIVSKPVPCGEILDINNAPEHIFGFVLLNDWSARDIQLFEMPPLGPFNSKAFGTTISNWVVTLDALDPFACPPKHEQTNFPLEHLQYADAKRATFDIKVESYLVRNGTRYRLCISNLKYLLWTPFQQITHQASSMCGMRTGDIIGTGTISGDDMENGKKVGLACLYEATQNGTQPVRLDDEQEVIYLKDGDSIILTAYCVDGSGTKILGFGECVGQLLPSL